MSSVSLCMIVKNEEAVLNRCLECVKGIADEIIIVDTGSTDRTKEIAYRYTDQVYDYVWNDNFSEARNAALQKGTKEYLLWLDADDVIPDTEQKKLLLLKEQMTGEEDIVMMKYAVAFDQKGKILMEYYRERLLKNHNQMLFHGVVHEAVPLRGKIVYRDIVVEHRKTGGGDPDRNLRIYEKMKEEKKIFDARETYYYGKELYYHGKYEEAEAVLEDFLKKPDAWTENKIDACRTIAVCLRKKERDKEALEYLFQSFVYDVPRAEICCDIAALFFEENKFSVSAYWYDRALECRMQMEKGGFVQTDYYGYIPALGLCVCYDRLGNRKKAREYNDMAGTYHPYEEAFLYNKKYFKQFD